MKEILNKHKSGLIFGTFAALLHIIWSIFVALGVAENIINFSVSMHFFNAVLTVQQFNLGTSIILVALTFGFGYILGILFASVVNFYNKK